MTIGEMIAQLRSIQDSFGDLLVWPPVQEVVYRPENPVLGLKARAELSFEAATTLQIDVSDRAAVGDQLG